MSDPILPFGQEPKECPKCGAINPFQRKKFFEYVYEKKITDTLILTCVDCEYEVVTFTKDAVPWA